MNYNHIKIMDSITVTPGNSGLFEGFVALVTGKPGKSFGNISLTGAMIYEYNVQLADGGIALLNIEKTTQVNDCQLQILAVDEKLDGELVLLLPNKNINTVVDIYGNSYAIMDKSSYLYVSSTSAEYKLNNKQSEATLNLYEQIRGLAASTPWQEIWNKNLQIAKDMSAEDIVACIKNFGTAEAQDLLDQCYNILEEIPLSTYELSINQVVDDEAPVINTVTNVNVGERVKFTIDAQDNMLVEKLTYTLRNAAGEEIMNGELKGSNTFSYDLGLEQGYYFMDVTAYDYNSKNSTTITNTSLFVEGNGIKITEETVPEEGVPTAITPPDQEAEAQEEVIYMLNVEHSGEYTFNFSKLGLKDKLTLKVTEIDVNGGAKPRKVLSTTLQGSRTAVALMDKNMKYEVSVTSKSKASTVFELQAAAEFFKRANQIEEDNIADYKKQTQVQLEKKVTEDMKITVETKEDAIIASEEDKEWVGFSDSLDLRQMEVAHAGKYTFNLHATDKAKFTVYSVNAKNGKLKAIKTTSIGKGGGAKTTPEMLLDKGTYFVAVESPNAKKGGRADYFVEINEHDTAIYNQANPQEELYFNEDIVSSNWVGFGNAVDTYNFSNENGGSFTFNLGKSITKLKLTILEEKDGKYKTVKKFNAKNGSVTTTPMLLKAGVNYQIVVTSTKANKGEGSNYELSATNVVEFNKFNNTLADSTYIADGGWQGVVSTIEGGDAVDFLNIADVENGRITVNSGKVVLSFFDENQKQISASSLGLGKKDDFIVKAGKDGSVDFSVLSGVDYIKAESTDKKLNQYSITLA